jgi:hypothetical protein
MRKHHSNRASGQKGRFVPRLETLEDRLTPAANFVVNGSSLLIFAPTTHNSPGESITINDNGGTGANNITAFSQAPFVPNVVINDVEVFCGRGNDKVFYNLTGPLTGFRSVSVHLGNGNNKFVGTVRRDLLSGSFLGINVFAGNGNDRIILNQIGSLQASSNLQFNAQAGNGDNSVTYQTTNLVNVGAGALLGVNIGAGRGNDHLATFINAVDNGDIAVNTSTGGGSQNSGSIDLEVLPGSTGNVDSSSLNGGPGNDFLTFIVHNRGSGFAANQMLNGGGGFDTATRTNNVIVSNVLIDRVVP